MPKKIHELKKIASSMRKQILEMCVAAGSGHVSSAFSCTELLIALYYGDILRFDANNLDWDERDRFILSKGQSGVALYPVLADLGFFPTSELINFTKAGSNLGVHSESNVPGIEAVTGSLGHGIGLGAGLALAAKMDKKSYMVVVMLGDAECYEGSIWEAAMFAAHQELDNMVAIVDRNWLGVTDFTEKYLRLNPFEEKWKAFGWDTVTIDGHSFEQIFAAFKDFRSRKTKKPLMIVAETVKGKGISFMENHSGWHYVVPKGEELRIAMAELNAELNRETKEPLDKPLSKGC